MIQMGVREIDEKSPSEIAFVRDAFCRGIVNSRRFDSYSYDIAMDHWSGVFDYFLENPDITVAIVVDQDNPNVYVGFVVYEPGRYLMHYIYIKLPCRRRGYATKIVTLLTESMGKVPTMTIQTPACFWMAPKWGTTVDESILQSDYFGGTDAEG